VNPALRSRAILLRLEPLSRESIVSILARAVHSDAESVILPMANPDGPVGPILPKTGRGRFSGFAELPEDVVAPEIFTALTTILHRLPSGRTGIWDRSPHLMTLDVTAALALGDRFPFLPVQDRLVTHLEEKTGRTIRSIEIGSELWDNGYFFSETVEVHFSDGDGDLVAVADMSDFEADLRNLAGDPGPNTSVTITRTSAGVTIR
jgi:hypothetical protein